MGIMEDLIRYLIPTGLTYRLYNYDLEVINAAKGIITDIYYRQDKIVRNKQGDAPQNQSQIAYPFNPAMLLGGKVIPANAEAYAPEFYNVPPTSLNFGKYGTFITNTFIYRSSEGEEAGDTPFNSPFMLYVLGQTLVVLPEKGTDGSVIAPIITYDPDEDQLILSPGTAHLPTVTFDPQDIQNSEGTLVWNESD